MKNKNIGISPKKTYQSSST